MQADVKHECKVNDEEMINNLKEVIQSLSREKGALIPALQSAQNCLGYLPESILIYISEVLDIPYSEVAGVVSFYSYFTTIPKGKNIIRVCLGTACYVRGGKEVLASIKDHLKIDVGETTPDKLFSLEVGRCFGACGLAPVVLVNEDVHQRINTTKVKEIISNYRNKAELDD